MRRRRGTQPRATVGDELTDIAEHAATRPLTFPLSLALGNEFDVSQRAKVEALAQKGREPAVAATAQVEAGSRA